MNGDSSESEISRLLADGYSQRILAYTYRKPMSAQRLSKLCKIPIAACYRRIHDLESFGLVFIADEKEVRKGRRVKLYRCALKSAVIRFSNGKFRLNYDTYAQPRAIDTASQQGSEVLGDNGSSVEDDRN